MNIIELSLKWYDNCILPSAGTAAIFRITDTKRYVQVVTLKTGVNAKLSKLLSEGFKRSIYWNEYTVIPNKNYNANEYIRERLDASFQGVNRLFVFPYMRGANLTTENNQDEKSAIITLKLMVEISMIDQLMTQLNNMMKSEKHQQDKVMITQLVVY